jgi:hypothetical protein
VGRAVTEVQAEALVIAAVAAVAVWLVWRNDR